MKPLEIDPLQMMVILGKDTAVSLHQVVDDRRMKPFMTMEEFEKKWSMQSDVIEKKLMPEETLNEKHQKKYGKIER